MSSTPLLTVLIPTLSSRQAKLQRLLDVLLPQAEADGRVEVVGLHNDGVRLLAEYRQALLEDARGKWLCFADDDDLVSEDYIPAIMEALGQDPDFVAFQAAYYVNGVRETRPVITGIQHGDWHDTAEALVRDVIHVCPVRAPIAKTADFRRESAGQEDWSYVSQIRPLLKSQAVIDRVLYHYRHDTGDSVQTTLPPHAFAPRLAVRSPSFRWHPWSTG